MHKLRIQEVGRQYGDLWALRNISLEISQGVLGLLGPNGAGKSTLMRIITTISQPTEGQVLWDGQSLSEAPNRLRNVLGYLPQNFGIYPKLTAREFLRYLASAKGIDARERIDDLLLLLNLNEAADRRLETFSGGMKQRVGIAQALLNDPELLIVDEPTVGLDPEERARFRNLLSELAGNRIVILSTHIVSDVEAVAEQIAILHEGDLLANVSPEELLTSAEGKVWKMTIDSGRLAEIRNKYQVTSASHRSGGTLVRVTAENPPGPQAEQAAPNMEDAYLWIMQKHKAEQKTLM